MNTHDTNLFQLEERTNKCGLSSYGISLHATVRTCFSPSKWRKRTIISEVKCGVNVTAVSWIHTTGSSSSLFVIDDFQEGFRMSTATRWYDTVHTVRMRIGSGKLIKCTVWCYTIDHAHGAVHTHSRWLHGPFIFVLWTANDVQTE